MVWRRVINLMVETQLGSDHSRLRTAVVEVVVAVVEVVVVAVAAVVALVVAVAVLVVAAVEAVQPQLVQRQNRIRWNLRRRRQQ